MDFLEKLGKKRTILISISILIISLHSIYFYISTTPEIETKKITQQVIRFFLTVVLLLFIYKGKNWARIAALILFSIGVLSGLIGIFTINQDILLKTPLFVMVFIYSFAIHFFGFSESFKAFAWYQNEKENY
ncbi:hypothetical protein NAT51_13520 [Flavobacterium amniphilum]|nr:hypothetical protein [Flavobacterium amniphilum]